MNSIKRVLPRFFIIICLLTLLSIALQVQVTSHTSISNSEMAVSQITVDDTNHDQQITLEKGNILIIKLLTNPGIGYGWQIIKNDAEKLQPVGDSVLEPLEEEAPGATENQVFRFLAKDIGFTCVELHYLRPWESNVPPLKTYRLNVQIR